MWFKKKPDTQVETSMPDAILGTVDITWLPEKVLGGGSWRRFVRGRAIVDVADSGTVWAWAGDALVARIDLSEVSRATRTAFMHTLDAIAIVAFKRAVADVSQEREIRDVLR